LFKKGFYLQASPGLAYFNNNIGDRNSTSLSFYAAIGAGLDIGITKLLTISPFIRYTRTFGSNWQAMKTVIENGVFLGYEDVNSDISEIQTGLRIGYRFDYKGR